MLAPSTTSSDGQILDNSGEGTTSEKKHSSSSKAAAHHPPKKQRTKSDEQTAPTDPDPDIVAEQEEKTKATEATKQCLKEEGAKPRQRCHHDEGNQGPEEQRPPSRPSCTEPPMESEQEQDPQPTTHHWVYIQGCSATELDQAIAELPANILETIEPKVKARPLSPPSPQGMDDRFSGEAR
jgi:hypothetical protein